MARTAPRMVVGWREWAVFPELGAARVKAKIDTGARTSAIHAWAQRAVLIAGVWHVDFVLHPLQRRREPAIACRARLLDIREVRSSNGAVQTRHVISTPLRLGGEEWPIELTLADRDAMGFRAIIGRQALRRRAVVDPGASFLLGSEQPPRSVRS